MIAIAGDFQDRSAYASVEVSSALIYERTLKPRLSPYHPCDLSDVEGTKLYACLTVTANMQRLGLQ